MSKAHLVKPPMFDTLAYAKTLEVAGMSQKQAEAQAVALVRSLSEAIDTNLVTKPDLIETKTELKQEISALRIELKQDIAALRTEVKQDIAEVKVSIIKWVFAMFFMQSGLIISLLKFLH